ncbi:FAD/NAD(P)-binding domain-containing protein [Rhizopus microsporus var. microsporus]|uniref:FAD/NAD(P)-binding domain-containing protein n=2 Tax=Rhizopus microsporus TaxID=58291 RepID=A0A2G4SF89_RHIZD|nr:FAD/NAD(P)-binding domain-containing protein [Rhizopus microsporus ATCC 52813]ORE01097.1 FAD/NAD(P)-binding domain-containing protein [Rhizopus microsporus var. microsporus]PHZ07443.1 FAD/NAD(P)-binding domain-containing protein [Rhizopus microsporus ATCC 52813]
MVASNITEIKNIVFIGASSAAMGPSLSWLEDHVEGYRLVLIEEKTHYNHVFAFPRASVLSGFEDELFIPYDNLFNGDDTIGRVINARATAIHKDYIELDREVPGFGKKVEYDYLVYTAGTKIPAPGRFNDIVTKEAGIDALKRYQKLIQESEKPVIIGAGAVGLELAAEIKEHYPEKHVTLVHSRNRYLPRYKVSVDVMIYNILKKAGIKQVLGDRVILPPNGFPLEVKPIEIQTKGGNTIHGDLAIMCIGMTPNSELMKALSPDTINKDNGFIKVKPTMQILDERYPNIFAAGDVIDHTDVKTGHYAWMQGLAALTNIRKLINGASYDTLEPYKSKDLALIKVILGKKEAVMQTHVLGPLVAVGSWIAGRSIPHNVYATTLAEMLKAKPSKDA